MTGNRRVIRIEMNNWLRKLFLLSFFLRGRRKMWYNVFYDEIEHCDLKRFIPCNLVSENLYNIMNPVRFRGKNFIRILKQTKDLY